LFRERAQKDSEEQPYDADELEVQTADGQVLDGAPQLFVDLRAFVLLGRQVGGELRQRPLVLLLDFLFEQLDPTFDRRSRTGLNRQRRRPEANARRDTAGTCDDSRVLLPENGREIAEPAAHGVEQAGTAELPAELAQAHGDRDEAQQFHPGAGDARLLDRSPAGRDRHDHDERDPATAAQNG